MYVDITDPDTYNRTTSSTIYDSMGQPYKLTTYYLKDQNENNKDKGMFYQW